MPKKPDSLPTKSKIPVTSLKLRAYHFILRNIHKITLRLKRLKGTERRSQNQCESNNLSLSVHTQAPLPSCQTSVHYVSLLSGNEAPFERNAGYHRSPARPRPLHSLELLHERAPQVGGQVTGGLAPPLTLPLLVHLLVHHLRLSASHPHGPRHVRRRGARHRRPAHRQQRWRRR